MLKGGLNGLGGRCECASNGEEKMGSVKRKWAIGSFPSCLSCSSEKQESLERGGKMDGDKRDV